MSALPKCCFCYENVEVDELAYVLPLPMLVQTDAGSAPMNVFAHKRCGKKHGKQLVQKMVEFMLTTALAATLSRAQLTQSTPNGWVGSPAANKLPARPYVAIVS